jgi:hypothetical protein
VACLSGPAHAHEMVRAGAGLVAASRYERVAGCLVQVFAHDWVARVRATVPPPARWARLGLWRRRWVRVRRWFRGAGAG